MMGIYIFLIALAAFPLILTIRRMRVAEKIKKTGIHTNGVITHINTIGTGRGGDRYPDTRV